MRRSRGSLETLEHRAEVREEKKDEKRSRMRLRAKTEEQVDKAREVDKIGYRVAILRAAHEKAAAELALEEKKLFEAMKQAKAWTLPLDFELDDHAYNAVFAVETPLSRSSTIIDPTKFHAAVADEHFYNCISVSVTKAREVLGEKQIERISTTKNPEKKPPVLVTKYILVDGQPVYGKSPKP
jgi:hypothetical protein